MSSLNLRDYVDFTTNNNYVQGALQQEKSFRETTSQQIGQLRNYLVEAMDGIDFDDFKTRLQSKVELEKAYFDFFAKSISEYKVGQNVLVNEVPWSVKTLKMKEAIDLAHQFLETHRLDGTLPQGYQIKQEGVTILGKNEDAIWGDSKGTALKTVLTLQALSLKEPSQSDEQLAHPCNVLDLSFVERGEASTFLYDAQIPVGLYSDQSSFLTMSNHGPRLSFIHSGYAFGGHRDVSNVSENPFAPEDCSSWIARTTDCLIPYSTYDQLQFYRSVYLPAATLEANWTSSVTYNAMRDRYGPVLIRDPQKDIEEGQVYCHRRFDAVKDPTMATTFGIGGHTALVTGFVSNGPDSQVVTIGYNRDMPNLEGFGLQAFPYKEFADRQVMVFNVK